MSSRPQMNPRKRFKAAAPMRKPTRSSASSSSSSDEPKDYSETSDSKASGDSLLSLATAPAQTINRATIWLVLGLSISYGLRLCHCFYSTPSPSSSSSSSGSSPLDTFRHQDFQILHSDSLTAFGLSGRPGMHATVEQVQQCTRQLRKAHRTLSQIWHPDTCRYHDVLERWQCEEMYRLVQEKKALAEYDCLNLEMKARAWDKERRADREMEEEG